MKLPSVLQMRAWDAFTIKNEPITSLHLMQRAAAKFTDWITQQYPPNEYPNICCVCGSGNNGGDGFAIANFLTIIGYKVQVFACKTAELSTPDTNQFFQQISANKKIQIKIISDTSELPLFAPYSIIIDALFGYGLNRPLGGYWAQMVQQINEAQKIVLSVDMPSGLLPNEPTNSACVEATKTGTFQTLKPAQLLAENGRFVGECTVLDIGLHARFQIDSDYELLTSESIKAFLHTRNRHDHKGVYGHALLIMGGYGMTGAAVLAARACMRSGVGRLTIHAPKCAYDTLQTTVPEAMVSPDEHQYNICTLPENRSRFAAIGVGCGLGLVPTTIHMLRELLSEEERPLVLDADALNILAQNPDLLGALPENSILTPHPKEFERLFGATSNEFERLALLRHQAATLRCVIVLKGGFTTIACPDGRIFFHNGGHPGMATGGSGDILTGIVTGLLAQGYTSLQAAKLGVFLHGRAAELALSHQSEESFVAGDVVTFLGAAFKSIRI